MYLKSLELQGFKSFPDKTKLTFEGGATVIVGPNGSGKSNISDAMRWVLGEVSSKSIRGTKMEDIIFGGADSRRPMGYAEVSVTFDNSGMIGRLDCPYDEVTVTRRYYRSGESEYYINRRAVRLRDIYEMFMNTGVGRDGYSIIGQGKIAEIVSRKSDERRSIFEDASGIAKYRHKKSETERRLAATEDNMTRINDVFAEVSAQVAPLEKEAEKAKKAIDLLDTKKRVDIQLWLYDTEKLRTDVARCEESFRNAEFDLQNAEDSVKALEVQNDKLFEISQSNQTESENLLGQIREQTDRNHALDSTYRIAETNVLHTKEMIAAAEGAKESANKSIAAEEEAQVDRTVKIAALGEVLGAKESEYTVAQTEQSAAAEDARKLEFDIDCALSDVRALESEMASVEARISFIENSQTTDTDKNAAVLREIENYEKHSVEMKGQCEQIRKTVEDYDGVTEEAAKESEAIAAELADLYRTRHDDNESLTALRLRRDSAQQRIDTFKTMEQQFEGYSGSVRFVMKKYAEGAIRDRYGNPCGKIYGPLSTVINVEDRYLTAIETALGPNLQHIVVEDESVAKEAMFALKKAEAGRATFFPLTSMKGQSPTPEMKEAMGFEGYVAVASELVGCDKKFSEIVSGLLGRTMIFDTVDHATAMAKSLRYRVRAVTLDGQQINVGGSFTGGSVRQNGNILGRAGEIKRLEGEVAELNRQIEKMDASLKKLAQTIADRENDKDSVEQKMSLIKVMRDSENNRLEQLTAKLDANEALTEKLRADYGDLLRARERYEEDRKNLLVRRGELEVQIREIGSARADMDVRRNEALDRKTEAEARMTAIYIAMNETKKDIETEERLSEESDARLSEFLLAREEHDRRIGLLHEKIAEYNAEMVQNREEYRKGSERLDELNDQRSKIEEGNAEFKRKLNEVNAKMREKLQQKELIFKEYTRYENRLQNLRSEQDKLSSRLWDEHEMTRSDAVALGYPALDATSRPEAAAKQTECRNKLRVLGNVDLDAVNKYKEVKARYDYMEGQIRDLEASRAELAEIIGKLEGEMETAFVDSFNQINENFNRVFGELFGGGSAELSLTDPDNVLESGIEIKAAPPGKIIKNMVQLSGGEQSFIAIALFFAILQVNPTPFCILDEIEAALDEVNVARFAEYIKRYASGTQFIMITHRRGTMEAANRLYGVTMPERGISKVLELDVNDISKKKGEDWDGIFG
ncbi:MAG: chromosome segregation protein SMC [Clostridia bacterium]|nr:chromosome segregation protein SMC [Clostridia bacterium]